MRSQNWLQRQQKDIYVKKAIEEGYLSRAAFKLIEIENKYKIISNSKNILELGSAPGGWSQVICNINQNILIDAFDILDMQFKHPQIRFFKEDFSEFKFETLKIKYDLVLSDVAPNTIGHQSTDHLRIIELIEKMLDIVENYVNLNGNFAFKLWKGSQDKIILDKLKKKFKKISIFKPHSSRSRSSEIYVVAQKFIV
tara:strand:- start:99 stop:689 length:591 start_codon:yes stop_codon:yes gene_type:complete